MFLIRERLILFIKIEIDNECIERFQTKDNIVVDQTKQGGKEERKKERKE